MVGVDVSDSFGVIVEVGNALFHRPPYTHDDATNKAVAYDTAKLRHHLCQRPVGFGGRACYAVSSGVEPLHYICGLDPDFVKSSKSRS